jgi:hypothetical protein
VEQLGGHRSNKRWLPSAVIATEPCPSPLVSKMCSPAEYRDMLFTSQRIISTWL